MNTRLMAARIARLCCAMALMPLASADEVRDPMRPPHAAVSTAGAAVHESPPTLTAVFGTPKDRVAVVNGQLVRGGGSVGGYVIEEVFAEGIRYRHAGMTHDLYLPHMAPFKKAHVVAANPQKGVN